MYGNIEPKSEINNFVETEKEVFYYLKSFSYLENIFSPILSEEYFESGRLAKEIHYKNGKEMFYKSYFDNDNKQEKEKYSNGYSKDNPNRYYAILGVNKNITKDELKKVYYKLVKKYHPDKFENSSKKEKENAENKMKEINEAYEYLMKNFI